MTYKATSSDKKKYGLDKPSYVVDVSYYTVEGDSTDQNSTTDESKQKKTDHVYQFSVGKKDKSGDNYYVSIHGEKGIYRMSAETIDGIVAVTPMNMLCNTPHKTNVDTLQEITLTQNGKTHKIVMTKKEVKNAISEDNSKVYDYYVKLDDKSVDQETFRTTYQTVFGNLVYRRPISDKQKVTGNKSVGTITLKTDDRTLKLEFLPYDGVNFYRIKVDGQCHFLVDKNVADKVFEKLLASK